MKPLLNQLNYLFNNLATVEKATLSNISNLMQKLSVSRRYQPTYFDSDVAKIEPTFTPTQCYLDMRFTPCVHSTLGYGIVKAGIRNAAIGFCWPRYLCVSRTTKCHSSKAHCSLAIGTVAGLLIGVPLLTFFPSQNQLVFIVIGGNDVLFAFRINNYGFATGFITLLVLFCFNQLSEGCTVVLPGSLIPLFKVCYSQYLPWSTYYQIGNQNDCWSHITSLDSNKNIWLRLLANIVWAKKTTSTHRIARRSAHNNDANLTVAISSMLVEDPVSIERLKTKVSAFLLYLRFA